MILVNEAASRTKNRDDRENISGGEEKGKNKAREKQEQSKRKARAKQEQHKSKARAKQERIKRKARAM